jgi:hypothetical protein
MLNLNDIYIKNEDDWVSRVILDEVVIMPLCRSEDNMQHIYSIANETGVKIFQLLDGKHSVKEIQEVLKKEFQGKNEDIEEEVLTFIGDLLSVKFIEKSRKATALKADVSGKRDEGRLLTKKKPYRTPEIAKVKMQPEQAVLSCCTVNPVMKIGATYVYCANSCQPTNGCIGRYSGFSGFSAAT